MVRDLLWGHSREMDPNRGLILRSFCQNVEDRKCSSVHVLDRWFERQAIPAPRLNIFDQRYLPGRHWFTLERERRDQDVQSLVVLFWFSLLRLTPRRLTGYRRMFRKNLGICKVLTCIKKEIMIILFA